MPDWSLWTEGAQQPFVHPDFHFAVEGVQSVGQRLFGEAWTGREMALTDQHIWHSLPATHLAFDGNVLREDMRRNHGGSVWFWLDHRPSFIQEKFGPTVEDWREAFSRCVDVHANFETIILRKALVLDLLHKNAALGWITFYVRDQQGDMIPLSASHWNADEDVVYPRLAAGKSDDAWLFLRRDDLALFVNSLPPWEVVQQADPPPPRSVSLAKLADRCTAVTPSPSPIQLSNDDTAPTRRQSKPAPQRSKATRYVGRKSGPARKPRLIKQEIFRIFKAADALLSNRSAPERTKFIAAHWSGAIEIDGKAILAPSKNTVERYWVEWKDKLAEQGKSELDQ